MNAWASRRFTRQPATNKSRPGRRQQHSASGDPYLKISPLLLLLLCLSIFNLHLFVRAPWLALAFRRGCGLKKNRPGYGARIPPTLFSLQHK